jgi:hypothetical protein
LVDAARDAVGSILGLLFPLELMLQELMMFINADALFVDFVSVRKLSGFIFSQCDVSF